MDRNNTIRASRRTGRALPWLLLGLLAFAFQLSAHGGFEHVIGTVVKMENNVVTVKTAKGDVNVRLNEKTEITKSAQKADAADLKPGVRVVVDIPEGSKDKIAHSIKIGVSGAGDSHSHSKQ